MSHGVLQQLPRVWLETAHISGIFLSSDLWEFKCPSCHLNVSVNRRALLLYMLQGPVSPAPLQGRQMGPSLGLSALMSPSKTLHLEQEIQKGKDTKRFFPEAGQIAVLSGFWGQWLIPAGAY